MEIVSGAGVNRATTHCLLLAGKLARRGHHVTLVCRPGAWIAGGVDHPIHSGVHDGARTHGTGLQGYVQGGIGQTVVLGALAGIAQCHDLRMGGGIMERDWLVETLADDLSFAHQHRTHRHLAGSLGLAGQHQGMTHEMDIGIVRLICHGIWDALGMEIAPLSGNRYTAARINAR